MWTPILFLLFLECTPSGSAPPLSPTDTGSGGHSQGVVLFVNTTCEDEGFPSEAILPDVKLATDVVNSALQLESALIVDTITVEGSSSLSLLVESLLDATPKAVALLYPGCSQETGILADISGRLFNLTVMTYVFPSLPVHASNFSNLYQMFPSEHYVAGGLASFIAYFDWNRTVVLTQDIPVFTSIFNKLKDSLEEMSINVTNKILIDQEEELFPPDNRVFVLNMYPNIARAVLCQAYVSGMIYPGYVWITYGWYSERWWEEGKMKKTDNCSNEEILSVLNGAIALTHYPFAITTHPQAHSLQHSFRTYSLSAFDAVLSLVNELLRQTHTDLQSDLSSTESGIFNGNRVRNIGSITFYQYRKSPGPDSLRLEVIGSIPTPGGNLTLAEGEDEFSLWPEGVPSDGTPQTKENYPLLPLMVVCYTGATAGMLLAIVCLLFNIVFRNKKLIRLTSPTLNYVIIAGTIVFYSSVYTYFYVPSTSRTWIIVVCNLRLWLTSLGYVLTYVPINVKMWRVFHICHKPTPSMKNTFMKDWHLILIIGVFVILDLILLTIVTAVDSSRYTVKIIPDKEHPGTSVESETGLTISYTVSRCYSATEPYWISVLFGYKLLLQVIGVFLAFNIRKVKIKGLNDSKEVSAILYITTVLIGVVILVTFVFGDYINVDGGTYGLGITTATTVVLTFIFIPKMYGLYHDPKGENIFSTPSPDRNNQTGTARSQLGSCSGVLYDATDDSKVVIATLKKRISELEARLGEGGNMCTNPLFLVNGCNGDEPPKLSPSGDPPLSPGVVERSDE